MKFSLTIAVLSALLRTCRVPHSSRALCAKGGRPNLISLVILAPLVCTGCHSTAPTPQGQQETSINIVMKKWSITPDVIRVKKGELVHLHITTPDVQHGFDAKGLNISQPVNPGKPTDITFAADKPGTYGVECGILCGRGHDDMTATIIVED